MFRRLHLKQITLSAIIIVALLSIFPAKTYAANTKQPVTQYMLVDRLTDGDVVLRDYTKVASLLKQIGFKVSVSTKGLEPTTFTLSATRVSRYGGTTSIKYSGNDMAEMGVCEIIFGNTQELNAFLKTLDGTGWVKKGNKYSLGSAKSYVTVVATLRGNTITLVEKTHD